MTDPFAKDVAKQLDRRHRRRRLVFLSAVAAIVLLAVMYVRFGGGWGIGGGASGGLGASKPAAPAGPRRCAVRVTATGITVDGRPATRDVAVAACKATTGADVVVTGDAREGDWDDLRAAFDAAHVVVYQR